MRKKIIITVFFLLFLSSVVFGQQTGSTPTPIPTGSQTTINDLGSPYDLLCVSANTPQEYRETRPPPVVEAKFSGSCPSSKPCRIVVCSSGGAHKNKNKKNKEE